MKSRIFTSNNKSIVFMSLSLFTLVLLVLSCTKSENGDNTFDISKYSEVGKLHNEGLSYVFTTLSNTTKSINSQSVLSFDNILMAGDAFLVEQGANKLPVDPAFYDLNINFQATKSLDFVDNLPFSPAEKVYLADLIEILYEYESIEEIDNHILKLQQRIVNENKVSDLDPILYACEVTKYSYAYWKDNMEAWISEFSTTPVTRGFWSDLRDAFVKTAVMDGTGAAVGAIVGGVGALPGGLGTSLIYCANEVVNSF